MDAARAAPSMRATWLAQARARPVSTLGLAVPEGMAIGASFAKGGLGLPLASAIAPRHIPEGLAVARPLRAIGLGPTRAVLIAAATGLMEPRVRCWGWGWVVA